MSYIHETKDICYCIQYDPMISLLLFRGVIVKIVDPQLFLVVYMYIVILSFRLFFPCPSSIRGKFEKQIWEIRMTIGYHSEQYAKWSEFIGDNREEKLHSGVVPPSNPLYLMLPAALDRIIKLCIYQASSLCYRQTWCTK